jgi:hypothetical protein
MSLYRRICLPLAVALALIGFVAPEPAAAQILGQGFSRFAAPFLGHAGPQELNEQGPLGPGHALEPGSAHLPYLLPMQNLLLNIDTTGLDPSSQAASPQPPGDLGGHHATNLLTQPADAPDASDLTRNYWEMVIGSCAGGAFLATMSAATATAPVAATGIGAPAAGSVILLATASGCMLGVATTSVSSAPSSAGSNSAAERPTHRPIKRAGRFSRNAATPSRKSSVAAAAFCRSRSRSSC